MAKSVATPAQKAGARVTHAMSGAVITIEERDGKLVQQIQESGLTAEYPLAFQIGAGNSGRTYVVRAGSSWFESPVSWYARAGWEVSPGYEHETRIDFNRRVTSDCLFCHTSGTDFAPIGCERCHGASKEHLRNPSSRNIVNPAKLAQRARDSVCEQCHLEGEVRVLNPGKQWSDFTAGEELEKTFAIYVERGANRNLKAVSQAEELAQSKCAMGSGGRLWCGSCHDPHAAASTDSVARMRGVCRSCHAAISRTVHTGDALDCVACHMPRRSPTDIAHTSITDHRIRRTADDQHTAIEESSPTVAPWHEPDRAVQQRDLGLAYLQLGAQQQDDKVTQQGMHTLGSLPSQSFGADASVLAGLGAAALRLRLFDQAVRLLSDASKLDANDPEYALSLGIAFEQVGKSADAVTELERSIQLDPDDQRAPTELVRIYATSGRKAAAIGVLDRYLRRFPQSIDMRVARARLAERAE